LASLNRTPLGLGLVLPDPELIDEPFLTLDEMKLVIDTASEPYKTYFWILTETGIRCGEACGLPTKNLLLDIGAIKITQKVWHGQLETVKSKKIVSAKFHRNWWSIFADICALGDQPTRASLRYKERHPLGCRPGAKAQTVSITQKAKHSEMRISRLPPRQRNRDGRRACAGGYSDKSARSLRRTHDNEVHTRNFRRRPQNRARLGELLTSPGMMSAENA
jgi:integrase